MSMQSETAANTHFMVNAILFGYDFVKRVCEKWQVSVDNEYLYEAKSSDYIAHGDIPISGNYLESDVTKYNAVTSTLEMSSYLKYR